MSTSTSKVTNIAIFPKPITNGLEVPTPIDKRTPSVFMETYLGRKSDEKIENFQKTEKRKRNEKPASTQPSSLRNTLDSMGHLPTSSIESAPKATTDQPAMAPQISLRTEIPLSSPDHPENIRVVIFILIITIAIYAYIFFGIQA